MLLSPAQMHIPDGFLSIYVAVALWIVVIPVVGYALRRAGQDIGERQVPMMGVLAAAIFAGQMLNFAVAGGTSGHLMGAALATILLGPWASMVIMTCVVSIQALVFQDGGLLALGANIFNMGLVGVTVSYMVYRLFQRLASGRSWGIFMGGAAAAWLSVEIAALGTALQLALSGTSPANIAIPTMGGIHALIGIGEALITLGALSFLYATRRDLVASGQSRVKSGRAVWLAGLAVALLLAIASPLASTHPDGLNWVAQQQGFIHRAQNPAFTLIPGYQFPGITNGTFATILSGILGTLIVFGVALAVAYARRKRSSDNHHNH